ncbi:MAG: electron transfer flavoprotein subunit alpha/FixB family protein [Ardenticatenia bacterium]|jgi:electron transfer flavoprotein alpha subunit|nr:MAG: electron transfer flavoprotein subunit alpha/FixB family protein [Ardenticatenia bacterium]
MSQDIYVVIEHLRGQVADISYVLCAAARQLAAASGGQVVGVLLGHNVQGLAQDVAVDRLLVMDDPQLADFIPDRYQQALAGLLSAQAPRVTLFGDTSIGAELAGGLSVQLGWPLVSYCRSVRADDGRLLYISQLCGGKVMAEGEIPAPHALLAMVPGGFQAEQGKRTSPPPVETVASAAVGGRITLKQYIEPESGDVDISKEAILVSVGRGIQNADNIEMVQELAAALGGVVSASRPVVDQGWLPTTRLVGKSGKRVKPRLYLALGISGAPEHAEAITDSQTIIAVNTDASAPIFDIARYGTTLDLFDLVPALTEKVRQAKQ